MKTITKQTYKKYKSMLNEYSKHSEQYRKENKTNGIPFEVYSKFPFADKVSNAMRGKIEQFEFINNPPNKYFIYIRESTGEAITWNGDKLGSVNFGKQYISNFGDKRINISMTSINGVKYYGTFFKSSGDYARIKRAK